MEYVLNVNDIKSNNLLFRIPVKNQNPQFLHYYKMIYTNKMYNLKYVLLKLKLNDCNIIQENNIYYMQINNNSSFFKELYHVEKTILNSINSYLQKRVIYSCFNEIKKKKFIYMFTSFPKLDHFYLKISGVWESLHEIGIVYKLHYNTSTEKLTKMVC